MRERKLEIERGKGRESGEVEVEKDIIEKGQRGKER